jgi:hypothetical protein
VNTPRTITWTERQIRKKKDMKTENKTTERKILCVQLKYTPFLAILIVLKPSTV